jgi:putative glutathione S-transferase
MGLLVDGRWQDKWYDTRKNGGRFKRSQAAFRSWVTADGAAGPSGDAGFKAEPGRYHLYVALACPWAHRTLIFRSLKGLADMIDVSVVNPIMKEHGWTFQPGYQCSAEPLYGFEFMHQLYTKAMPDYTGRVTVPVLWDKQRETIVSNESADIIRMFNSAFDSVGASPGDYYPSDLSEDIDSVNEQVYHKVNNGVYKAGFATTQDAYEEAVKPLFETLDELNERLASQRYLCGARLTEADWRLFTTLVRFDAVYVGHFKCNIRRIEDYRNLAGYLRELYQHPGIADGIDMHAIKLHYYGSHDMINPTGVVPVGPALELSRDPQRNHLAKEEL